MPQISLVYTASLHEPLQWTPTPGPVRASRRTPNRGTAVVDSAPSFQSTTATREPSERLGGDRAERPTVALNLLSPVAFQPHGVSSDDEREKCEVSPRCRSRSMCGR